MFYKLFLKLLRSRFHFLLCPTVIRRDFYKFISCSMIHHHLCKEIHDFIKNTVARGKAKKKLLSTAGAYGDEAKIFQLLPKSQCLKISEKFLISNVASEANKNTKI